MTGSPHLLQNVGVFLLNVPHFAHSTSPVLVRVRDHRRAAIPARRPQVVQPAQVPALALPVSDRVVDEIQLRQPAKILDRENGRKHGLQSRVFPLARQQIHLQEALVGFLLHIDQVRNLDRRLDFGEVQAFPFPHHAITVTMTHGPSPSGLRRMRQTRIDTRPAGPGRTFFEVLVSKERAPAAAGDFLCSPAQWPFAGCHYLISTLAPASSNFFLIVAASSLLTPSFTVFGAPSTRSLASFKPRLVTSRTALITLILFAPTSVRTTANSVFSSGCDAAAPAARRSARHHHWRRSSRRDSEGLFHFLDQIGSLQQRQTLDFFQNCFHFASHCRFLSSSR